MFKLILVLVLSVSLSLKGQDRPWRNSKTYQAPSGKLYSLNQIDSLVDLGHFVGMPPYNLIDSIRPIFYYKASEFAKEGQYCGNKNKLPLKQIRKLFPFDQYASIMMVSLKDSLSKGPTLPRINAQVDKLVFFETKVADNQLEDELLDVLVNFKFNVERDGGKIGMMAHSCYNPRNAILFVDKDQRIISYVEICFECKGQVNKPADIPVGIFCDEKYGILQHLLKRAGIKRGTAE